MKELSIKARNKTEEDLAIITITFTAGTDKGRDDRDLHGPSLLQSPEASSEEGADDSALDSGDGNSDAEGDETKGLEDLMNEFSAARQAILSLPDDERRRQAASLTLSLMSKLNLEEE